MGEGGVESSLPDAMLPCTKHIFSANYGEGPNFVGKQKCWQQMEKAALG